MPVNYIPTPQVRAEGRPLTVPGVFYILALLRLPQLYVTQFFVRAVESGSELLASTHRVDAFLSVPEPPPPVHLRADNQVRLPDH